MLITRTPLLLVYLKGYVRSQSSNCENIVRQGISSNITFRDEPNVIKNIFSAKIQYVYGLSGLLSVGFCYVCVLSSFLSNDLKNSSAFVTIFCLVELLKTDQRINVRDFVRSLRDIDMDLTPNQVTAESFSFALTVCFR